MLNIKDIEQKLKKYPEPKEVKEIREHITKTFSDLDFFEVGHKYIWHSKNGDIQLPSVSGVTHAFVPPTDWEEVKRRKAAKLGVPVEQLTREWEETNVRGTNNGTSAHLFGENYMYFVMGQTKFDPIIAPQYEKGYLIPYAAKENAVEAFYCDLMKLYDNDNGNIIYPVMAEAKLHTGVNAEYDLGANNYAGTTDMVFAHRDKSGKFKLLIYDFKTNKELTNDYARSVGQNLTGEFSDMYNESLSLYTLQLSAYSLCLMQLGYEIADRKLIWLKDDGTYEKHSVPDVTDRLLKVWR